MFALCRRSAFWLGLSAIVACAGTTRSRSAPPPRPGAPPPAYGSPAPYPSPPPVPGVPQEPPPLPAVGYDPINAVDIAWLRNRAGSVLGELVAALPAQAQQRVTAIPFVFDATVGRVNAFAACIDGKALMAITDGLLEIAAHLSQARAADDVFGSRKVDGFIQYLARNQQPDQPIVRPPPGFYSMQEVTDGRKVARQKDVLDELLAFVLAHELAHHHLGHLPCTGGAGLLGAGELARALSDAVPLFNQPNELAADAAGTNNVLSAGARRSGYRWTESGGLLTMQFFSGVESLSVLDVLFAFERTHPPPGLRVPVIQQTANFWRMGGSQWLPLPTWGG